MLLPSALPCERDPRPTLRRFANFDSSVLPTPRPASISQSQLATGIGSTCRALHSLLGVQPHAAAANKSAPIKNTIPPLYSNSRIKKRRPPPPPPRGHKRSRETFQEDNDTASDSEQDQEMAYDNLPSTPKRQRLAPPSIPFGLERSDFYNLQTPAAPQTPLSPPPIHNLDFDPERTPRAGLAEITPSPTECASDSEQEWGDEDDSLLIDMVLDKLKLSKRAWVECAEAMGTDEKSLGRRWKYLVDEGQVGLKFRREGGRRKRGDVRALWR